MTPNDRKSLALLLAVAFALRLVAGWGWQSRLDGRFGMGDSDSYWTLALTVAEGKPYECGSDHMRVFRTPGYPILLSPILWLVGDNQNAVLLARAEAALLGTLAVAAVWWLARLLFDDRAALLAAALATFYPGAIVLSALILSEAPFCALMLLQLALWTVAWQAPTKMRMTIFAFCGGLAAGAATLMRPSWLLFTPMAALIGLLGAKLCSRDGRTTSSDIVLEHPCVFRHMAIALCMTFGLVAAMLPWWIRNVCVTGRFIPTTLQVGASLYDGLSPDATGASNMNFVPRFVAQQRQQPIRPGDASKDAFEIELDQRMQTESIAWAKENPDRVLQLAGVKFLRMWNVWPNEPQFRRWPIQLAVFFTYTPLLIFAIIGAWRTLDRGWPYILCWLPAVYFTLLHMVFVSSIRYREPAMLALLVLAAGAGIRRRGLGARD